MSTEEVLAKILCRLFFKVPGGDQEAEWFWQELHPKLKDDWIEKAHQLVLQLSEYNVFVTRSPFE